MVWNIVNKYHKVVFKINGHNQNGEFSWTKGNNSWRHDVIWTIINLEEDIDLIILEIMFLFFKNTAKKIKFMYIFDQFRKS